MTSCLVCGGRDYRLMGELYLVMDALHAKHNFDLVIHGDAVGADTLADKWANDRGIQRIRVPANWNGEGKKAGPIRNEFMLEIANPEVFVAFPGGAGTYDMILQASRWGSIEYFYDVEKDIENIVKVP